VADSLRDLICGEIPEAFFRQLAARQDAIYQEARGMAYAGNWTKPEADTVAPIVRRALFEDEVRRAAKSSGLQPFDMAHAGGNYGYVLVRAGKLIVTAHHVLGPNHFVRPCKSREQNASVNRWLDTLILDGTIELPTLDDASTVNAYLLHGIELEERAQRIFETPFLQVAIPDAELNRYQRNYPIGELIGAYSASPVSSAPITMIPDRATPTINQEKVKSQNRKDNELRS
jgi:hypothetical protein